MLELLLYHALRRWSCWGKVRKYMHYEVVAINSLRSAARTRG
jgi:hypothetical protein